MENSSANKARTEQFITRFARWYTPTVVIAAVLLAFVPPLFLGDLAEWVRRALMIMRAPLAPMPGTRSSSSKDALFTSTGKKSR